MRLSTSLVQLLAVVLSLSCGGRLFALDDKLRQTAIETIKHAATFYRTKVALKGGYVYYYSLDLKQRLGEGVASPDQIWVQPPGTPTVGMAFLEAYDATGDDFYLDAATDAALALIYGQLESGAWTNAIDFDPRGSQVARYRNGKGKANGRNFSTLDDGISQAAIQLLIHVDQAHNFQHKEVHQAANIALDALLKAQFPNGGFPQGWDEDPIPQEGIVKANYPRHDWRTEGRVKNYWDMYTLNDGLAGTVADTLIDAHRIYGKERFEIALRQLGRFLILAQMPDPQPAWAQQYNYAMQPIWARRFEPAAIAGRESQDAIETLLKIHRATGDDACLQPLPKAIAYLKKSLLPDGRLARYYELQSNKPLYMTRTGSDYKLTYDDSQLPSHYGWKTESFLDELEDQYNELIGNGRKPANTPSSAELATQARKVIADLDDQGRWISTYHGEPLVGQPKFQAGQQYIDSALFSRNIETLGAYLRAGK